MPEHNLEQRKTFVDQFPCLSQDAISSINGSRQSRATNDYLVLQFSGEKIYPTFQFDNEGKLKPGIKTAVLILSERHSAWKIAFWLTGEGVFLDGERPVDHLDDIEWIKQAARQEAGFSRRHHYSPSQPTL
jgi:hypothetical protein